MYKNKRSFSWWMAILITFFIVEVSIPTVGETTLLVPDNQEMKLLLKNDFFYDRDKGYEEYWGIMKTLAMEMGVGIIEGNHAFREETKEVVYYDTLDMDLGKKNYILRQRTKIESGQQEKKSELTLKYRMSGGEGISDDAVVTSSIYKPKISVQEDEIGFYGGIVGHNNREMSLSHTLKKITLSDHQTLGDYTTYFPTLGKLEINLEEPMYRINGVSVSEYKVVPGVLDFGGMKGEVNISLWFNDDNGKPIVAEISWECRKTPADALARAEDFFMHCKNDREISYIQGR